MSTSTAPKPPARRGPLGLPLLPAHYATVVMPLFLSIIMTCIVSLVSTLRGVGLAAGFLPLWLGSWALSWVIAFPTLLVVLPLVRKATYGVVQMPHEGSAGQSG